LRKAICIEPSCLSPEDQAPDLYRCLRAALTEHIGRLGPKLLAQIMYRIDIVLGR